MVDKLKYKYSYTFSSVSELKSKHFSFFSEAIESCDKMMGHCCVTAVSVAPEAVSLTTCR